MKVEAKSSTHHIFLVVDIVRVLYKDLDHSHIVGGVLLNEQVHRVAAILRQVLRRCHVVTILVADFLLYEICDILADVDVSFILVGILQSLPLIFVLTYPGIVFDVLELIRTVAVCLPVYFKHDYAVVPSVFQKFSVRIVAGRTDYFLSLVLTTLCPTQWVRKILVTVRIFSNSLVGIASHYGSHLARPTALDSTHYRNCSSSVACSRGERRYTILDWFPSRPANKIFQACTNKLMLKASTYG